MKAPFTATVTVPCFSYLILSFSSSKKYVALLKAYKNFIMIFFSFVNVCSLKSKQFKNIMT